MPVSRATGPLPPTIGPYVIAEKIGSGGMATVYRALRPDGKQVAIKVLAIHLTDNENIRKRFEREVFTLRQLKHPHILPLEDAGHDEGRPYFVMPLLTGHSLASLIKNGPLPVNLVSSYTHQIATALDYAHAHQVIHRDIKPSNILIDEQGQPFLADFGVAHLVLGEQDERLTTTGEFLGTPLYAAPEQSRGEQPERAADLYSFAVMVFEMSTGRVPFEGPTGLVIMKKHFHDPVPNPREFNANLPGALYDVLTKGMAKLPAARYRSALEFSTALDGALGVYAGGTTTNEDDDDWLHPPAPPIAPPPPAAPAQSGFDPDSDQIDGPDDPFAGFDDHAAPPPARPAADEPFDDQFDAASVFEDDLAVPPVRAAADDLPDPEPEQVIPPRAPHNPGPTSTSRIRPLGPVPAALPRAPFPWAQIGVYGGIVLSLVAIIAAVYLIYRELNPPEIKLDREYRSTTLGVSFRYPAAWSVRDTELAILSDQAAATVILSNQPIQPGESITVARLVIAVQRVDPVKVYSIIPDCRGLIASGPAQTFNCQRRSGYVTPVYSDFATPISRGGAKLPGSLPVQRASLPVILLPSSGSDWVAVMIIYWDNFDDARDLQERLARSVRLR